MKYVIELEKKNAPMPKAGEVWLWVETGELYEVRLERQGQPRTWDGHRIGAPEEHYGCDPTVFVTVWPDDVKSGRWLRVANCPPPKACPCHHTTPCDPQCSCASPFSSAPCSRCCTYGSPGQQRATAERLARAADMPFAVLAGGSR